MLRRNTKLPSSYFTTSERPVPASSRGVYSALSCFAQTVCGSSYDCVCKKDQSDTRANMRDLRCIMLGQWSSTRGDFAPTQGAFGNV